MFKRIGALFFIAISVVSTGCSSSINFNENQTFYIRTRIIIEEMGSTSARSYGEVVRDLAIAEEVYQDVGLKFVITEMILAKPFQDWYGYADYDAERYPNTLSIYYTFGSPKLGKTQKTVMGMGMMPLFTRRYGVFVNGLSPSYSTLAHEVGHYFGLYHTFHFGENNDLVDDTYSEEEYADLHGEDADYKEYDNVMNYHNPDLKPTLTEGQKERILFHLKLFRSGHLIQGDLKEIPLPLPEPPEIEKDKNTEKEEL